MKLSLRTLLALVAVAATCSVVLTMTGHWKKTPQAPVISGNEAAPGGYPSSVKRTYHSDGKLERTVVYRLSKQGNPLTCDIFDAEGVRLLKHRFGYGAKPGPDYGKLVEVQVVDARNPRKSAEGKEMPIRRILYPHDPATTVSQTVVVDLIPPEEINSTLGPALAAFNPATDWQTGLSPLSPAHAR